MVKLGRNHCLKRVHFGTLRRIFHVLIDLCTAVVLYLCVLITMPRPLLLYMYIVWFHWKEIVATFADHLDS